MRKFNPNVKPWCGWVYTQPETHTLLESGSYHSLILTVQRHRMYKKLGRQSTAEVMEDVDDQMCLQLGPAACGGDGEYIRDESRDMTLEKMQAAGAAMVEFLKNKGAMVSEEEAQRRAEICKGCRFNRPTKVCSCSPFFRVVEALLPARRKIDGLGVCAACGCSTTLKTQMPQEVIDASNKNAQVTFPSWCWQNKNP
jgi:hypothetical protein